MKRIYIKIVAIFLFLILVLPSCATIFGGTVSVCQRTVPATGMPAREIRVGALIADILLFVPSVIVDFATCAIYRPCDNR